MERHDSMMRAARFLLGAGTIAAAIVTMTALPAAAETCGTAEEGVVCGTVTSGTDPVAGVRIEIRDASNMSVLEFTETSDSGAYAFLSGLNFSLPPGDYTVCLSDGAGGCEDTEALHVSVDVDGNVLVRTDSSGDPAPSVRINFALTPPPPPPSGPGTGTPGYWKNHPEAWPVTEIQIGNTTYTREQAIALMGKVGGDKSVTIFSSLLSAKLNVLIGNADSCVANAVTAGDAWFVTYVAKMPAKIAGSSIAWSGAGQGDATHQVLDNYNNGLLPCARHRN